MSKIKIILNGEEYFCAAKKTLRDLIEELDLDIKKIAVEKNLRIISPQELTQENLAENDKIEIVYFIGGG